MKRLLWATVFATLSCCLLSLDVAAAEKIPIKVGIIDTYSGTASTYTNDVRDGFKLAVDEINAKGVCSADQSCL